MKNQLSTVLAASFLLGAVAPTSEAQQQPATLLDQVNLRSAQPSASIGPRSSHAGTISVASAPAEPAVRGTSIDFNDGFAGDPIDDFYASLGISFSNAAWNGPIGSQNGTPSSGVHLVDVTDDGFNPPYSPSETTPIVATFSRAMNTVSVLAIDVGYAGASLRAYDGVGGGNVVAEDSFIGRGIGVGVFDTLTVTGVGIRRIEIFQPLSQSGDGVLFDNITFSDVVVLDFETEDDFETTLANGQGVTAPGEFGEFVSIAGLSASGETAAIFDSTPAGPNAGSQDPDLLVDLGNVLILQGDPAQTVPGTYDSPNDDAAGGDIEIDFLGMGANPLSVDLIDICPSANQTTTVTLTDGNGATLVYLVPSGWTEDVAVDGPLGYRTLDLTTLEDQPGFLATATASAAPGFDGNDVESMRVSFEGSGAMDNLAFRPAPNALTVETFESFAVETVLTTQIPGLIISADDGMPTIKQASLPVVPGEPHGLAHIPYFSKPDRLQIDFEPSSSTAGAIVDFGGIGSGVRMTAYSGPNGTGITLGTVITQSEGFIGIDAPGIRSVRFETLPGATYLIDNLTYKLE